jgi:LPXTG-motif cell wall-anchored protein
MQMKQAPIMAYQPTGEQVDLAAVVTAPPAVELQADAAPMAELPHTSSVMPLMALFGLLALGGALSLRMVQKRIA